MAVETFTVSSSGKVVILKDPDAVLDYTFDWTDWLAAADDPDDVITTADCEASTTVSGTVDATYHDASRVTAWVSGGEVGEQITLRCRITTQAGRIDDRTVYLKVKER